MLWCMSVDRELLPPHEREAAKLALEEIIKKLGTQTAVGEALRISQGTVNRALLYTRVGPVMMRALLEYLNIDLRTLLERYGKEAPPRPEVAPLSIKDEAIAAGVKYGGGVTEREVRAIADKWEPMLQNEPIAVWVETVLREIVRNFTRPRLDHKAVEAPREMQRRKVRRLKDRVTPTRDSEPPPGDTKKLTSGS
jgi:hypothetical protein